ncbi:MAG: hypothetical protein DWQ45_15805 [Planctomycetota bacterium]|nr:MAG: hypothetical protein DWQ41_01700 [Planctomycetota bacterium]REK33062.1 MAG: hypothetical protein DWQ45_15805 [Planctomycetota bacterium]
MSAKGGTSLGTLLVSVPLAAIPLMAIFGIPEFAPVVASPDTDEVFLDRADSAEVDLGGDRELASDLRDAPEYNPFESTEMEDAVRLDDPAASPGESWANSNHGGSLEPDFPDEPERMARNDDRFTEPGRDDERATPRPGPPGASRLTWDEAARRLSELSISDYHLEPGVEEGTFLFVCAFAPDADSNVVMRFEAESAEPLAAVEDVLGQVDHWLRQRFADTQATQGLERR